MIEQYIQQLIAEAVRPLEARIKALEDAASHAAATEVQGSKAIRQATGMTRDDLRRFTADNALGRVIIKHGRTILCTNVPRAQQRYYKYLTLTEREQQGFHQLHDINLAEQEWQRIGL